MTNHLLKKYTSDEAFAKADAAIFHFTQSSGITSLKFCKAFYKKAIRAEDTYGKNNLNDIFIEEWMSPSVTAFVTDGLQKPILTRPNLPFKNGFFSSYKTR